MKIDRFMEETLQGQYLTKFQRQLLEQQLEIESIPEYRQRIEIMLLADEGKTQTQICRTLTCSPLTARHWILMAKSGEAHNWQSQPIGRPKTVTADYLERLQQLVGICPKELGYPFHRWTGQWLSKHLCQEFQIEVSARHINRLIGDLEVSTRPIDRSQHTSIRVESAEEMAHQPERSNRPHHVVIADLHDRHRPASSRHLPIIQ